MLLDQISEMLKPGISNVTGLLPEPLNLMDLTYEQVIEIVPDKKRS